MTDERYAGSPQVPETSQAVSHIRDLIGPTLEVIELSTMQWNAQQNLHGAAVRLSALEAAAAVDPLSVPDEELAAARSNLLAKQSIMQTFEEPPQ